MNSKAAIPIIDGHNDTLLNLFLRDRGKGRSFFERSSTGHIDLPRAREGGFAGGFFAIFVPPNDQKDKDALATIIKDEKGFRSAPVSALDPAYARDFTLSVMAAFFRLEAASEGKVKLCRSTGDIEQCLAEDRLAVILHFEGAEAIDPGFDALHVFYQAGLRSLGIVWSRPNDFGYGVPFAFPQSPDTGPGLRQAGKDLVRECNKLGIMLDLAHLNEKGFWDVARLSDAPLVVTHACAHSLSAKARNLTDKQLDAIADSGGVVGVNFFVADLRADGQRNEDTPVAAIAEHVDYIVRRIGAEHVAFGSDFDGAMMPEELKDVAGLPKVLEALRDLDYDDATLRKICHSNWLRVLGDTWN